MYIIFSSSLCVSFTSYLPSYAQQLLIKSLEHDLHSRVPRRLTLRFHRFDSHSIGCRCFPFFAPQKRWRFSLFLNLLFIHFRTYNSVYERIFIQDADLDVGVPEPIDCFAAPDVHAVAATYSLSLMLRPLLLRSFVFGTLVRRTAVTQKAFRSIFIFY